MSKDQHYQTVITPTKKTLRRKPPPSAGTLNSTIVDDSSPRLNSSPSIPPRPNKGKFQNQGLSVHTNIVQNEDWDYSYANTSADDPLIYFESPKPMGPKELPDYNSPFVSFSNVASKTANTPQKELPYPIDPEISYIERSPPYPVDEFEVMDMEFSDEEDFTISSDINKGSTYGSNSPLFNRRSSQLNTPTKNKFSYLGQIPIRQRKSMPVLATPEELIRPETLTRSSEKSNYRLDHRGFRSQPTDLDVSPTLTYRNTISERGSRSPSPKKMYKRSPSLMYNTDYFEENVQAEDDGEFLQDNRNNYTGESRLSESPNRWTLVESSDSEKSEIHTYEDDYEDTPITTYFDYSILPELPSASDEPTIQQPLYTDFKSDIFDKSLASVSRNRRDHDLPPVPLDLPSLPFSSASLTTQHFTACEKVWSLGHIFRWCLMLKTWLNESYITKRELKKALIKLIVFHKPNMTLGLIGSSVDQIIHSLTLAGAFKFEERVSSAETKNKASDIVKIKQQDSKVIFDSCSYVSGVLVELTDCYCRDHDHMVPANEVNIRCYSSQCYLNQMIDHEIQVKSTNIHEIILGEDWASHWKLTATDLRKIDKATSKKQSLIFDLLRHEQTFISRAQCFVDVVGPEFARAAKHLVSKEAISVEKFEDDLLQSTISLLKIHKEYLFEPLLKILVSDGKFIKGVVGISEIYFEWSRAVNSSLLKYISIVPTIESLLKNDSMKRWVDLNVRNMNKVKELKVNGNLLFLSTFNSRYQSLPLQLSDIRNMYDSEDSEYVELTKALEEIKKLGFRANDMKVRADNSHALKEIEKQLIWKKDIPAPNINLNSENRRFIFRGNLMRKSELRINLYTNHLILIDNYLFITEKVKSQKLGLHSYRVIDKPIPIEFLLIEEKDAVSDLNPISKSLASSNNQGNQMNDDGETEPSSFPFKLRYAGRGKHCTFTFSTKSEKERKAWINHLSAARTSLCRRLQRSELFDIQALDNTCFAYEFANRVTKLQVCAPYDPIEKFSSDAVGKLKQFGYVKDLYNFPNAKSHLVFSKVQCATVFNFRGSDFYMVGLTSGVYCTDSRKSWKKIINGTDISKIYVDTSINLLLVLGNKHLRYCSLDSAISVYYEKTETVTCISISSETVSFFEFGPHKGINMLFCARKKGNASSVTNFRVYIPETDNDGVFNAFRTVKTFSIQADCFGISLFNSTLALHTNKGFEILELDKLLPRPIPDISSADRKVDSYNRKISHNGVNNYDIIKKHISSTGIKAMGMFKLNNNTEFLLVYNDCAVFINKYGKVSRKSMLRFDFRAKSVTFQNNFLFLVCEENIEVWSISDFIHGSNRLVQVILGKDISKIGTDDGSLIFKMANPKVLGLQLILKFCDKHRNVT